MSGQQFIETLHQIGYPRAQTLSARSFDWMFEDETVLPLLSWFCSTVGHQNVLSDEEKKSFAELEQCGGSILEGAVLEEALSCLSSTDQDEALSLEALQEEVERMKEDLERHQKRKEKLVKTRNSLSLHYAGLTHRLAKFGDVEAAKKQEYRKSIETCHRANAEGIADIAGGELSRYQLLEASDPTSLLVKGQSQEAFLQDCQELARLQAVFPKSEGERINALVEAKCAANMSAVADDFLRKIQAGHFSSDIQETTRQVQETKSTLSALRGELKHLTEGEVGELVRELGSLQGTRVLTGDYRIKLTRQDYFTGNQDQVIKYLVDQRARNEFLTLAYKVEAKNHRDIHHLLTAVQNTLQERLTHYQSRMQAMGDPSLTKAKYDRGTIDTRDVASTCLHQILVPSEESMEQQRQLFLSYTSMVQAAESLKCAQAQSKAEAVSTADKYQDKVQNLETEVLRCENVLYADSSTVGGQPLLMPLPLLETSTQLEDMLHKLEAAILATVTDVSNKKKALKKDVLLVKERELFTYFHLHPERLQQTVDNLEKRLKAHSVK